MDITETPNAEDFMHDLGLVLQEYINLGVKRKTIEQVFKMYLEDLPKKQKKKPVKKSICTHACLDCFGGPCKNGI